MMQIEENDSDTFDLVPSKAIFISPWQSAASSTFAVLPGIWTEDTN